VDTATVRGIFPVLPKQTPELGLAACTDRLSSREPQSNNGPSREEAADDLGEAADKGTDDALKAKGLRDSFAAAVAFLLTFADPGHFGGNVRLPRYTKSVFARPTDIGTRGNVRFRRECLQLTQSGNRLT
jgi:hypothetical protein